MPLSTFRPQDPHWHLEGPNRVTCTVSLASVNCTEKGVSPVAIIKNPMCFMYVFGLAVRANRLGIQLHSSAEALLRPSWSTAEGAASEPKSSHTSGITMMWSEVLSLSQRMSGL